jgi:hypothetical protein
LIFGPYQTFLQILLLPRTFLAGLLKAAGD